MLVVLAGALYDALPLVPLVVALVWTLRYQKVADLSLAGSFSVAAGLSATMLGAGFGVFPSLLGGLLVGLSIGCLMGFAVNVLHTDSLLSGLIVLFISYAVSLGITQGTIPVQSDSNPFDVLLALERESSAPIWLHPYLNLVFIGVGALVVVGSIVIYRTEWGCAYRALEDQSGGKTFLRSLGVSPGILSAAGFAVAAVLASLSGILVTLRDGQATSSLGLDSLVEVIPAYVLGIALFEKRAQLSHKFDVSGGRSVLSIMSLVLTRSQRLVSVFPAPIAASFGVVLFFVIINAAQRLTGVSWLPRVFIGLSIMVILGFRPMLAAQVRERSQSKATTIVPEGDKLVVGNLTVAYPTVSGPLQVFDGFSMEAYRGRVTQIVGRNGSGKSTLLLAIIDAIESTGSFEIPVLSLDPQRRAKRESLIAYVPQHAHKSVASILSIAEHVALARAGRRPSLIRFWEKTADIGIQRMDLEGLSVDYRAQLGWLSGGEARRVLLELLEERANAPLVVVLDEPFSHLDSVGRELCKATIKRFRNNGHVVLLVDHGNYIDADERIILN
jgi:manganese/iron transport system ATP-binding protein